MRTEHDLLGTMNIDDESFIGIHTLRALENFPVSGYKIDKDFIKAYGFVKLACMKTIFEVENSTLTSNPSPLKGEGGKEKPFNSSTYQPFNQDAILAACQDLIEGKLNEYVFVDALQGGAGTSLNMNINEVIANRALEILDEKKGNYDVISPLNDINKYQSTNDTFPTALKIAAIFKFKELERATTELQEAFEAKEKEFSDVVKIGRTELMEAVLTTLGKEFSAYAEAISRDRWRIYKCEERLRVVNIGGTAIGTGVGAKKKYIFGVIDNLRDLTGIGLARAENLVENTQNADVFSEVSGILKAHATNLIKIANDLRLMASYGEIHLPAVQAGSSIMPGKVNPVIPEMVAQVGLKVLGNDSIISHATALGQLELNQNMPLIAFVLLESLELLINANKIFTKKCIEGIEADIEKLKAHINSSTATLTALLPKFGYEKLSKIAEELRNSKISIKDYFLQNNLLNEEEFDFLVSSEHVLSLGD